MKEEKLEINLDLNKVLNWLWIDKYIIFIFTLMFAVISVVYSLSLENKYTSKAVVISDLDDSQSLGGNLGGLGGLASMAGISLGGSNLSPEVLKEIITSNSFLASFIRSKNLEAIVMAAEAFDPIKNTFLYDATIYDEKAQRWTRKFTYPKKAEPNDIELAEKFRENLSVSFDRKTKLISIVYKSLSPDFSRYVISELIEEFNLHIKLKEQDSASKTLSYLKSEIEKTDLSEVKVTMQTLLEEQYKKLALTETRNDYAFKIIDEPKSAYKKSEPRRSIICIAITVFGFFLTSLVLISLRLVKRV